MKTFTRTEIYSTHGTSTKAQRTAERLSRLMPPSAQVTYTVKHMAPRLFSVIRTEIIVSEPRPVRSIFDGSLFICRKCGGDMWYYKGRGLYNEDHECVNCGEEIHPLTETGASQ